MRNFLDPFFCRVELRFDLVSQGLLRYIRTISTQRESSKELYRELRGIPVQYCLGPLLDANSFAHHMVENGQL